MWAVWQFGSFRVALVVLLEGEGVVKGSVHLLDGEGVVKGSVHLF